MNSLHASLMQYPEEFQVILDCHQRLKLSVQLEGEQLGIFFVVASEERFYSDEQSLLLDQLDWTSFNDELDEMGFWNWPPYYSANDAGCEWGIHFSNAQHAMTVECRNSTDQQLPPEDTLLFHRFVRALGELTGQDFLKYLKTSSGVHKPA